MLWQALASVRDLGRLHDIASILVRYGFGDLVRRLGLANALERAGRALHWERAAEYAHLPPPARVRRAMEELGPTFVKLGQVLSTRVDLLEPEWIAEFAKLQDSAPAVPYEAILPQLTEDLGAPPETVFAEFDPVPVAAASIAQVYRARLQEGGEVVVKVRRPGIVPVVEADLRWMLRFAQIAESESPELKTFNPQELVRRFRHSLRDEMDFSVECRNAARIAENFAGWRDPEPGPVDGEARALPVVMIPRIHWPLSSERVCVQERVEGIPGRALAAADAAGLDRKLLARRGARAVLKMILEDGFFHADPHPGNVFYLPGNRLAFIDFGMVGRLTDERRDQLLQVLLGLVQHEPSRVAEVLLEWASGSTVDEEALVAEIEAFVERYRGVPLKQLRLGSMLSDMVAILRSHHITLPADTVMLVKAFVSLEGMGRELDPEFDMAGEAMPMLERLVRSRYAPKAIARRGWIAVRDAARLIAGLPQDLSRLLRAARRGRLEVHIDVVNLQRVANQLDRAINRLVLGVVIAALIIGSSIVMTVSGGPTWLGLPFFGLLGFLGAFAGGLWLFFSLWRSNRRDQE